MHQSNTLLDITFSLAVYIAFIWFFGNRFVRGFLGECVTPLFMCVIIPIISFPAIAIIFLPLHFFEATSYNLEISIFVGMLFTILFTFSHFLNKDSDSEIKFYQVILDLPFLVFAFFAASVEKIKHLSNPAIYLLQEKKPIEAVGLVISNFKKEVQNHDAHWFFFLIFLIFFLNVASELWLISDFLYWDWYLKYSDFQKYLGYFCFVCFSLFLFYLSHRQRLKAVFGDCIFVLRVTQNSGSYFLLKGYGEIVEKALDDDEFKDVQELSADSAIFFLIGDKLCVLLDSRIEFRNFLTMMRLVRERGVDWLAERDGITKDSFEKY
jgi:hypothetical protein